MEILSGRLSRSLVQVLLVKDMTAKGKLDRLERMLRAPQSECILEDTPSYHFHLSNGIN